LIIRPHRKFIATRCQILRLKRTKFGFCRGSTSGGFRGAKGAMAPPKRQKLPFALMNYSFTVANDVNLYISCLFNMQLIALSMSIQSIPSAADC